MHLFKIHHVIPMPQHGIIPMVVINHLNQIDRILVMIKCQDLLKEIDKSFWKRKTKLKNSFTLAMFNFFVFAYFHRDKQKKRQRERERTNRQYIFWIIFSRLYEQQQTFVAHQIQVNIHCYTKNLRR